MTQHYYLVASLPLLLFDDPPPVSSAAFLQMCREQVAPDDHALLSRISFAALQARPGDPSAWSAYSAWETALRDELAVQRAQRLGVSPDAFLRPAPFTVGLPALVKEALGAGTPMAVEAALDRRRWSYLEEIEAGTQFGLGRLVAYRLKLLLLERKALFRTEPGRKSFTEGYARVLGDAAARISAATPANGYGERT